MKWRIEPNLWSIRESRDLDPIPRFSNEPFPHSKSALTITALGKETLLLKKDDEERKDRMSQTRARLYLLWRERKFQTGESERGEAGFLSRDEALWRSRSPIGRGA